MAVESKAMDHIRKVLEQFGDKYFTKSGALKRNTVIEDLDNYDKDLMTAILKDNLLHKTYTSKIADVEIFEINKFVDMLHYKEYWEDSFTKYDNKIGLTAGGKYIDDSSDVVLDFPYKDCVLKAGMTKEDVEHSGDTDEPFLNETLAKPEIDELFEPKMFVNATKYDKNGKIKTNSISNDDNIIIKGNNLIALYSLKKRFAEKIKLIFIDPPYFFNGNKAGDSFSYNSNFKLSTWLTFMKNRLEVAQDLLSTNGFIVLTIGYEGSSYLKLLLDKLFGIENFVGKIAWRKTDGQANTSDFANVVDDILIYRKSSDSRLGRLPLTPKTIKNYSYEDQNGKFRRGRLLDKTRGKYRYEIKTPNGNVLNGPWRITKEEMDDLISAGKIYWPSNEMQTPQSKIYLKDVAGKVVNDFWDTEMGTNQRGANELEKLFGKRIFSFPKPEKLLQNVISMSTNKKDIVLDFFMGSATTQAVAMKMHRHFIGIEQMNYINTVSIPRLQKVIAGEQGGISKEVNWQGGGSFIYAELMEKDQGYIRDLQNAENMDELMNVYSRMKQNGDIDFRVDLNKFEASLKAGELPSLEDRKKELIKIIDKNQLYYSYSDIDDESVRDLVTDTDYEFNKSFYSSNNEKGEE